jgi:hypothetical protein
MAVTPDNAAVNDTYDVASGKLNLNGVETTFAGGSTTITRAAGGGDEYRINSVTINNAGALASVAGVDGTSFSSTRGADGGPPLIAVDSVEIAQIKTSASAAGVITAAEIFQVPGVEREMAFFPTYTIKYASVSSGVLGYAGVQFTSALPTIHTGAVAKKVYAQYYYPVFSEITRVRNFTPPQETSSVSSEQVYRETVGAVSTSLGQGSFEYMPVDGISDPIFLNINYKLWFKFLQDINKSPYIICQGYLNDATPFPADANIVSSFTISSESKAERVIG